VPGDRPGEYRFSHALVRSAVAARLSAAEQRRLHTAAADAIEALHEGDLRPPLAQIARHRVAGSWPGDRAAAVAACQAAAEVAADALAFEEAVRLYRMALSAGEPFRGQHVANGAGGGVYMGPAARSPPGPAQARLRPGRQAGPEYSRGPGMSTPVSGSPDGRSPILP
jgi:hypothetical protein